jgi:hypothetical protein
MVAADDLRGTYLSARPVLPERTRRDASLTVAEHGLSHEDVRDLLAVLGLIDAMPAGLAAPLPCGHAHTSLRRRAVGHRGTECVECIAGRERLRAARRRALRVTSS